jgi:hypothetical protein
MAISFVNPEQFQPGNQAGLHARPFYVPGGNACRPLITAA